MVGKNWSIIMTYTITLVKHCSKCEQIKAITKFYKDCYKKDGYSSHCKACDSIKKKLWWQKKSKQYKTKKNRQEREYRKTLGGCLASRFGNIKDRCENPNNKDYKRYGALGIQCKFKSVNDFIEHILDDLQMDRINNNGHYEKGNIRLTTAKEQANNRRNSK